MITNRTIAWQPIRTAPHGTILLFLDMETSDVSKVNFVDWIVGENFVLHPKYNATHWQPIPAPPDYNGIEEE